jgi:hypothetical protein
MTTTLRSLILPFVWLPLALAQTGPASVSEAPADSTADTAPDHENLIEKAMGIAGPVARGPLNEKERFHLYLLSVVGPVPVLAEVAGAAFSQWENSPKAWGQGWGAFEERAESNLAYNGLRETITYGTSIAFHEDNRYFPSQKHGLWGRTGYAVLSTVTARSPDGGRVFSVSSVAGVFGGAALSSIWGPRSWEGVEGIGRNAGISFALTAGFNIVREFLPDMLHGPHKR